MALSLIRQTGRTGDVAFDPLVQGECFFDHITVAPLI